jgi:hypothetical protein
MKDFIDLVKEIKSNNLSREFFYFLSGMFLLLILDLLFKSNLYSFPNIEILGTVGKIISFLVIAYFLSRICSEIGDVFLGLVILIFIGNKKERLKEYVKKVKKFINGESVDIVQTEDINNTELEHFIMSNQGVNFIHERMIQSSIFERIFLGFSLILSLFYSHLFFLLTLFLLLKSIKNQIELFDLRLDAARFFTNSRKSVDK